MNRAPHSLASRRSGRANTLEIIRETQAVVHTRTTITTTRTSRNRSRAQYDTFKRNLIGNQPSLAPLLSPVMKEENIFTFGDNHQGNRLRNRSYEQQSSRFEVSTGRSTRTTIQRNVEVTGSVRMLTRTEVQAIVSNLPSQTETLARLRLLQEDAADTCAEGAAPGKLSIHEDILLAFVKKLWNNKLFRVKI